MLINEEIDRAHVRLMDAVCSWERTTGRNITILVLPHDGDEPVAVSTGGKPWTRDLQLSDVLQAVGLAMQERVP